MHARPRYEVTNVRLSYPRGRRLRNANMGTRKTVPENKHRRALVVQSLLFSHPRLTTDLPNVTSTVLSQPTSHSTLCNVARNSHPRIGPSLRSDSGNGSHLEKRVARLSNSQQRTAKRELPKRDEKYSLRVIRPRHDMLSTAVLNLHNWPVRSDYYVGKPGCPIR